ncbi:SDR family NAD(P)-dependent oxidoreductase [Streptomyces sp. NPDC093109]|uniref:SDR family NAD(P)-dependent oxidoreductase n=1 Tax=Streptomyces sp. NPDC093109 TaxID=3154977 RepID=UPI00344E28D2
MEPTSAIDTAFVTGGASGLGRAVCERLAARGDRVLVADLDAEGVAGTVERVRAKGGRAEPVELDVTDADAVRAAIAAAPAPLTTVVACAGIARPGSVLDDDPAVFDRTMAVNVRGTYLVLAAAATVMAARRAGTIVLIGSTSSFTASSTPMVAYDTSKAAVRMLTQAAARELGPHGVRVNCVAPGTMDTPLMRGLGADSEAYDRLAERIPLGRLGTPEEIAEAVAFVSSPEASYLTGHTLAVDGGWLA